MIESDTTTAPAHWANYLVNGDASGLDDDEIAACDAWHGGLAPWYVVSTADEESERFTWSYQLYGGTAAGGTVIDYVIHRQREPACPDS